MGLDLTAHQLNEETNVYEFAPTEHFYGNILFFEPQIPSFKMDSRMRNFLIAMVGPHFQEETYKTGMYSFTQEEAIKTYFKITGNASNYEEWGMPLEVYRALDDFFRVCINNKYSINIG